ncbi:MAG TPA: hypothetical protein VGD35_04505 [Chitinophaga sp.]
MSVLKNISFRRIIALGLLALMLVVHGVKSFHHHTGTAATKHSPHGALVQLSGHHCLICDFQLTRDADLPPEQFSLQPIQLAAETCASYVAASYVAYLSDLKLRGPPVTA